ncbi:MAG: hypothetical protein HY708_06400, partial [Ignavibacteriae bacterium]|nr:hypothetical protein [Ignavibacteriota bacterium]
MENQKKGEIAKEPSTYHTRIKDWPADERPREKLLQQGAHALSDAELLAIILRTGTGKHTALDIARKILVQERNLRAIAAKTAVELMRMKGIGEAKAVGIIAAIEVGRRVQGTKDSEKIIVHSPED